MILLVGSQKGGTGKSTLAVNLAVAHAAAGRDVMLVDADAQRSASRWHADRTDAGLAPAIACVEKLGNLAETLRDLGERYEVVIVDVAGHDSKEMRTGMVAADQLLVVVRPSQLDLDTLAHMSEVVEQARDFNPELDARVLLNQVPTNIFGSERGDAGEYLADFAGLSPLQTTVHERKAYRDVIGEGRGVVESDNRKARNEILELVAELETAPKRR